MTVKLQIGRHPALSPADFKGVEKVHYRLTATGVVRALNTRHGARLLVECDLFGVPAFLRREFFVSMKSASYVRLCRLFGDDLAKWRGPFTVHVIRDERDGRPRVEVVK